MQRFCPRPFRSEEVFSRLRHAKPEPVGRRRRDVRPGARRATPANRSAWRARERRTGKKTQITCADLQRRGSSTDSRRWRLGTHEGTDVNEFFDSGGGERSARGRERKSFRPLWPSSMNRRGPERFRSPRRLQTGVVRYFVIGTRRRRSWLHYNRPARRTAAGGRSWFDSIEASLHPWAIASWKSRSRRDMADWLADRHARHYPLDVTPGTRAIARAGSRRRMGWRTPAEQRAELCEHEQPTPRGRRVGYGEGE